MNACNVIHAESQAQGSEKVRRWVKSIIGSNLVSFEVQRKVSGKLQEHKAGGRKNSIL